jgi:hypothetical protein
MTITKKIPKLWFVYHCF